MTGVSGMRYEVLEESVLGTGGFLTLRRLRLRVVLADGRVSDEGLYDMVEREMGLDAVVICLWLRRGDGVVEVLLRHQPRVPLVFSRPEGDPLSPLRIYEVVAGILEPDAPTVSVEQAVRNRAAAEILEEAGLSVDPARVHPLGPASFPTPGMCAERFHFCAAEITEAERAASVVPVGDGSPFEEGATLRWLPLQEALAMCAAGEIVDLKTELTLRRLAQALHVTP